MGVSEKLSQIRQFLVFLYPEGAGLPLRGLEESLGTEKGAKKKLQLRRLGVF